MTNEDKLAEACEKLVEYLWDVYFPWKGVYQFSGTDVRLKKMFEHFCWPNEKIEEELEAQFKMFDNGYGEMLVVRDICVWTLCPHHLLPCRFNVNIGYIPAGKVLGLSKFARIAEILAKRPVMQEEYTSELADRLNTALAPKGVAVYVIGHHGCMVSRGVKQDSDVVTTVLLGDFLRLPSTREEFYSICRR